MKICDLTTPALLLDLDVMESNLRRMADFFRDRPVRVRPHFKNHQVVVLATAQVEAGAIGITCARLSHAEALVKAGIQSVLIARELAGESMIRRFVELSETAPVMVVVDNPKVISDLARIAGARAHQMNVVVDVDIRLKRCGVPPGEAAFSLAQAVVEKGLTFRGLMGYEGHVPLPRGPEKWNIVASALQGLIDSKAMIEAAGIPVEIVSCGGTSDYPAAAAVRGVTEIQPGSYLLMDTWYLSFAPEFARALTLLTTVISKTPGERIVLDAGVKVMSRDRGLPEIKGITGLCIKAMHAEHGIAEIVDPGVAVHVGDKIELWVQYHDGTIALHDRMYGIRGETVEKVLRIER